MSRAKNENIDSSSSSEEETKKVTAKKTPAKKTAVAKKPTAKKTAAKKEPVKENSEDEFSDIEVEDDATVAQETDVDEVLIGTGKSFGPQSDLPPKQNSGPRRIDPSIPNGELNIEQLINCLIDKAADSYNLPLKTDMLGIKYKYTGKGKAPAKTRPRGGSLSGNKESYQPPHRVEGGQRRDTPNRDDYQMRGPSFGGGRGSLPSRGRGVRNNAPRRHVDNDGDIYADI